MCLFIIILVYFENINLNKRNILKSILILFFLSECFLGFYERYTSTLVFGNFELLGLTEYVDEKIENLNKIEYQQTVSWLVKLEVLIQQLMLINEAHLPQKYILEKYT